MVSKFSMGLAMLAASLTEGSKYIAINRATREELIPAPVKAARSQQPAFEAAEAKRKRKAERLKREAQNWSK